MRGSEGRGSGGRWTWGRWAGLERECSEMGGLQKGRVLGWGSRRGRLDWGRLLLLAGGHRGGFLVRRSWGGVWRLRVHFNRREWKGDLEGAGRQCFLPCLPDSGVQGGRLHCQAVTKVFRGGQGDGALPKASWAWVTSSRQFTSPAGSNCCSRFRDSYLNLSHLLPECQVGGGCVVSPECQGGEEGLV